MQYPLLLEIILSSPVFPTALLPNTFKAKSTSASSFSLAFYFAYISTGLLGTKYAISIHLLITKRRPIFSWLLVSTEVPRLFIVLKLDRFLVRASWYR